MEPKPKPKRKKLQNLPTVGDDLYLGSAYYLGHACDDFDGGLCRIVGMHSDRGIIWVSFKERPGHSYDLEGLLEKQDQWKEEYGQRRGKECPDYDPMFNEW